MSLMAALLASLEIVAGLGAATIVGGRVSALVVGESDGWVERLLVWTLVTTAQLVAVVMVCGMLDVLYAPVVLAVHLVAAAVLVLRLPPPSSTTSRPGRVGLEGCLVAGVLAFAGTMALLLSSGARPSSLDGLQYHLPNAAFWIQAHNIWRLPPVNPGYFTNSYPSNGELLVSWVIQPVHGSQLATFPTLLFGLILLLAAAMLGRQLGSTALAGLVGGAAVVLSPISWGSEVHQVNTDWAGSAGLLAAVALVLRARRGEPLRWIALAGAGLGLSVGSKDTALVPAVLVVGFGAVLSVKGTRWRNSAVLVSVAGGLSGVWFLRNAIQTGNPLYPEPIRIGGHTLLPGGVGPLTHYSASLLKDVVSDRHGLRLWLHWVRPLIGLAAILCLAALVVPLVRRADRVVWATVALAVAWFVAYAATPFTGPAAAANLIASQLRYAIPALVLAGVCASAAGGRWGRLLAWIALAWSAFDVARGSPYFPEDRPHAWVLATSVVVGALVFLAAAGRGFPGFGRSAVRFTGVAAGLLAVAGATAVAHDRPVSPSLVDRVYTFLQDRGYRPLASRPVAIIGVADVIDLMGPKLDHRVVGLGGGRAGEQPIATVAALNERLARIGPVAVVYSTNPLVPGYFRGWTPPGYRYLGTEASDVVYVLRVQPAGS
jgi:hypothetical protein